jgi:hypothetical protein
MDTQTPTDAKLRAKALARWENEGGAPVDEHGDVVAPQTREARSEPQLQAADRWQ